MTNPMINAQAGRMFGVSDISIVFSMLPVFIFGLFCIFIHELLVQKPGIGVVEALRREPRQEHDVFGRREPFDDFGDTALPGATLRENDSRERVVELSRDRHETEKTFVHVLSHVAESVDVGGHLVEQVRLS